MEIPYLLLQEAGIVGVASIYWLDDPRFESGQEQKVFLSSKKLTPSMGLASPSVQWLSRFLPQSETAEA
jgi:hypothetical protein